MENISRLEHPTQLPSSKPPPKSPILFIDCLDSVGKWCNGEIIDKKPSMIKVHFTGWSTHYDEWIDTVK